MRTLDSLLARRVPGTDRAVQPFWSPDSRFLAFSVEGKLKKVAVSGGLAQTIADDGTTQSGTWSKDGVLLFKLGRHGNLFDPSSGGAVTPATTLDASRGETAHTWPHFLPDGRHFLYHSQSTQPEYDGVLCVGSLDSTTTTPLGRTDSHAVYALGHLLYLRANTLVAHPFDAGGLRFAGEPVGIADKVDYNNITRRGAFSASETGTLVYRPLGVTQLALVRSKRRDLGSIGPLARAATRSVSKRDAAGGGSYRSGDRHGGHLGDRPGARQSLTTPTTGTGPETALVPRWEPDRFHVEPRRRVFTRRVLPALARTSCCCRRLVGTRVVAVRWAGLQVRWAGLLTAVFSSTSPRSGSLTGRLSRCGSFRCRAV